MENRPSPSAEAAPPPPAQGDDPPPAPSRRSAVPLVVLAAIIPAGVVGWHAAGADVRSVTHAVLDAVAVLGDPLAGPPMMVLLYVVGGLVGCPVLALIAATAMLYGPLPGFATALVGVTCSATVLFWIGRRVGRAPLERFGGARMRRLDAMLAEARGVVALAVIRNVPLAPFTAVNLVAGASRMRYADYMAGTVAGMSPGLLVISLLGDQVVRTVAEPSAAGAGMMFATAAAAAGLGWAGGRLLHRRRGWASDEEKGKP